MSHFYAAIIILFSFCSIVHAQTLIKDSVMKAVLIHPHYAVQLPLGELSQRFGSHSNLGGGFTVKFGKNFLLGVETTFMFGKNVKETGLFTNISTREGNVIGKDGLFAPYSLLVKGIMLKANFGKVVSFGWPNVNSGLWFNLGMGFLQHRIKIEVDEDAVPQLAGPYKSGYDRLTNGFLLSQFIGFLFLDTRKWINFYVGIEISEGFTKNRQPWNFDQKRKDDALRTDMMIGAKVGWIIPIYLTPTQEYYYY